MKIHWAEKFTHLKHFKHPKTKTTYPIYLLTLDHIKFFIDFELNRETQVTKVFNIFSFKQQYKLIPSKDYDLTIHHPSLTKAKNYVINSILIAQL